MSFFILGPQSSVIFLVPAVLVNSSFTFFEIDANLSGSFPEIRISTGVPDAPAPVNLFTLISASGILVKQNLSNLAITKSLS